VPPVKLDVTTLARPPVTVIPVIVKAELPPFEMVRVFVALDPIWTIPKPRLPFRPIIRVGAFEVGLDAGAQLLAPSDATVTSRTALARLRMVMIALQNEM
jgi:hypothetical protein